MGCSPQHTSTSHSIETHLLTAPIHLCARVHRPPPPTCLLPPRHPAHRTHSTAHQPVGVHAPQTTSSAHFHTRLHAHTRTAPCAHTPTREHTPIPPTHTKAQARPTASAQHSLPCVHTRAHTRTHTHQRNHTDCTARFHSRTPTAPSHSPFSPARPFIP